MAEKKKGKALEIILIGFGVMGVIVGCSKPDNVAPASVITESSPVETPAPRPEDDPNYTGIWKINNFVDEFGDKTDKKFISHMPFATGTFSNSAVKDEKLRAFFLITREDIGLQVYEDYFETKNDVAATFILFNPATVTIRDKDGTDHRLRGSTPGPSGQRLYITPYDDVISVLKMGGLVRFSINADGTTYRFNIENADFFDRAFVQIGG